MNGTWSRVEAGGRPADAFEPAGGARGAVLFLHGLEGESPRNSAEYTRLLGELGLGFLVPHGGPCWWADRVAPAFDPALTPERYLLTLADPFCRERWRLGPRGLAVMGIGMGGHGALRLAFRHPDRYPVVAAVSAAADAYELYGFGTPLDDLYDSKEQCRQDTAVLQVEPGRPPAQVYFACDPEDRVWFWGNERLREKLSAYGVAHTADLTTRAGGHGWPYFDRMAGPALRFVRAGLDAESRRLL